MEACPSVVRAEVGRTVVTVSIGRIVAVVEVVGLAGEYRSHRETSETGADFRGTCTENRAVHLIGREIAALGGDVFPSGLPHFLSDHGTDIVLAESVVVCQVVLYLPVGIAVVLGAAGIALS